MVFFFKLIYYMRFFEQKVIWFHKNFLKDEKFLKSFNKLLEVYIICLIND